MPSEADTPGDDQIQSWRELRQWFLTFNLRRIVDYHNSVLGMVLQEAEELDPARPSVVEWYRETNATNGLLLLAAYLEEMLAARWSAKGMTGDPPPGLKGFKPVLPGFVERPAWASLVDAFRVRSCILHQNGRIDLAPEGKRKHLRRILSKHPQALRLNRRRLRVTPEYLRHAVEVGYDLADWVSDEWVRKGEGKG